MAQNIAELNQSLRRIDEQMADIRRSIDACEVFLNTNRHDANDVRETTADINEYKARLAQLADMRKFLIAEQNAKNVQSRVIQKIH